MRKIHPASAPGPLAGNRPTLVVNSVLPRPAAQSLGLYGYSYDYVLSAFLPLLSRWAEVIQVRRPESQLDYAVRKAAGQRRQTLSLSFRPISDVYLTSRAPNVLFPFWEFPDIPAQDDWDNPRNNWMRIANRASLVLTASRFTADALRRAGLQPPVRVVPVPIDAGYFQLSAWDPGRTITLDCDAYVFSNRAGHRPQAPDHELRPGADTPGFRLAAALKDAARWMWIKTIKPCLPRRLTRTLVAAKNAALRAWRDGHIRLPSPAARLELSGLVYTTVLNPEDQRKNWHDILSAFLLALGDRPDATLVIKLVTRCSEAVRDVLAHYARLGLPHQARVVFITSYLNDQQMRDLTLASTYYVNASRAEGACLPLADYLAAGRPAIAPNHTAMADYFDDELGFVVASRSEPCGWPHDTTGPLRTSWHRIDWSSLHDAFGQSYQVASRRTSVYQAMAAAARLRMADWASQPAVWSRLSAALDLAAECGMQPMAHAPRAVASLREAS